MWVSLFRAFEEEDQCREVSKGNHVAPAAVGVSSPRTPSLTGEGWAAGAKRPRDSPEMTPDFGTSPPRSVRIKTDQASPAGFSPIAQPNFLTKVRDEAVAAGVPGRKEAGALAPSQHSEVQEDGPLPLATLKTLPPVFRAGQGAAQVWRNVPGPIAASLLWASPRRSACTPAAYSDPAGRQIQNLYGVIKEHNAEGLSIRKLSALLPGYELPRIR